MNISWCVALSRWESRLLRSSLWGSLFLMLKKQVHFAHYFNWFQALVYTTFLACQVTSPIKSWWWCCQKTRHDQSQYPVVTILQHIPQAFSPTHVIHAWMFLQVLWDYFLPDLCNWLLNGSDDSSVLENPGNQFSRSNCPGIKSAIYFHSLSLQITCYK